ncbi:hypothetical protein pb186bvf_003471 [Paramecium bursaria]
MFPSSPNPHNQSNYQTNQQQTPNRNAQNFYSQEIPTNRSNLSQLQQQQQEITEFHPQKIIYLRKLYLLMFLQFLIAIILNFFQFKISTDLIPSPWILLIVLFGISIFSSLSFVSEAIAIILYIVFTLVLYLFLIALSNRFNYEQSMMVGFIFGGQIFGQMLSVFQVRVQLIFPLQALYVLSTGLIIFQLFIVLTDIPFYEMVITLVIGNIFGFLLIYGTQTDLSKPFEHVVQGSVQVYSEIIRIYILLNELLGRLICNLKIQNTRQDQ